MVTIARSRGRKKSKSNLQELLFRWAATLPDLGRVNSGLSSGEPSALFLRPPLGRPIRLCPRRLVELDDGNLAPCDRIVIFACAPGICGKALPPSEGVLEPERIPVNPGGGIAVLDPNDERFPR